MLLAASAGFNDTGLTLLDIGLGRVTQFLPLTKVWNGLAFSQDGRRIFVSAAIPACSTSSSMPTARRRLAGPVKPVQAARGRCSGGIAVASDDRPSSTSATKANHEVWVLAPDTLALEAQDRSVDSIRIRAPWGRTTGIFTSATGAAAASA